MDSADGKNLLTVTTCWLFLGELILFLDGKKSFSHYSTLSFEKIVLVLL